MARIVAVNWRDMRNPEAGGAEVHLHEILTRLAAGGHDVTLFAAGYPGGVGDESYDGIRVVRRGAWYNANFVLPFHVQSFVRRNAVDLVVEDINKVPFFLPLFVDVPVVAVVPHLFGTTVYRETNALFATYVYLFERPIPWVYRRCRFAVISPSTKTDLVARGVAADRIDVSLCGLDHSVYHAIDGVERRAEPTLVHFGRVRKYKSVDVVIRAFARVREELPRARLVIVGDGPELPNLKALTRRMGLDASVDFLGVLSTPDLVRLLNEVHVFLNASPKEGWGLTVVEANACGLPVVASNRPGLRDSVVDGRTGFLVEYGDDRAFAERTLALLRDGETWEKMSVEALEWARSLTWERTAGEMEAIFSVAMAQNSRSER